MAKARCACGVWIIGDRAQWAVPTCVGCLPPPRPLPLAKPIAVLLVLLVLLSLVGCAGTFGGPSRGELEPALRTSATTIAAGLVGVDMLQTRWMTDNYTSHVERCPCVPGKPHGFEYAEVNPLLGAHPSKLTATLYLGGVAAGTIATRVWAPKWASWALSGVLIAAELYTVHTNAQNGESLW